MTDYVIHIAGPDDVIDQPDELTALREANTINKLYLQERIKHGDETPLLIATVRTKEEMENL